jgi:protein-tyrosine-phosphatase
MIWAPGVEVGPGGVNPDKLAMVGSADGDLGADEEVMVQGSFAAAEDVDATMVESAGLQGEEGSNMVQGSLAAAVEDFDATMVESAGLQGEAGSSMVQGSLAAAVEDVDATMVESAGLQGEAGGTMEQVQTVAVETVEKSDSAASQHDEAGKALLHMLSLFKLYFKQIQKCQFLYGQCKKDKIRCYIPPHPMCSRSHLKIFFIWPVQER